MLSDTQHRILLAEQLLAVPQLVAVQSLAFHVAAPSSGQQPPSLDVFGTDMPRPVPLQRWDADDARLAGNRARFGGFMEGACRVGRCSAGSALGVEDQHWASANLLVDGAALCNSTWRLLGQTFLCLT